MTKGVILWDMSPPRCPKASSLSNLAHRFPHLPSSFCTAKALNDASEECALSRRIQNGTALSQKRELTQAVTRCWSPLQGGLQSGRCRSLGDGADHAHR